MPRMDPGSEQPAPTQTPHPSRRPLHTTSCVCVNACASAGRCVLIFLQPSGVVATVVHELDNNVVFIDVETLNLPLDRVLDGAREVELSDALVMGWGQA